MRQDVWGHIGYLICGMLMIHFVSIYNELLLVDDYRRWFAVIAFWLVFRFAIEILKEKQ